MTDQYEAGMRRAAEIADEMLVSPRYHEWQYATGVGDVRDAILAAIPAPDDDDANLESRDYIRGWNAAMEAQGLEVIDPPPAPWEPPPEAERPDGFRCWAWWAFEGNDGRWYRAEWHGGSDDPHWWVFGVGFCKPDAVKHFLPEPPAPEESHE